MTRATAEAIGIRAETAADAISIRSLLEVAFGGRVEADLVERLRAADGLVLALVAEREGRIAGYVAFSRLTVVHDAGEGSAVGLAPLAVAPALQRRGIGRALVRAGLARLRAADESLVFVVGDPDYYRGFGFALADKAFESPYSCPYFMLLRLRSGVPDAGLVRYPAAFAELD